jgi:hypothetical protein
MSDIVERLRDKHCCDASKCNCDEAADEIEKLRAALRLAVDAIEHWASYASPYFQEKHDLAADLREFRAALGEKE